MEPASENPTPDAPTIPPRSCVPSSSTATNEPAPGPLTTNLFGNLFGDYELLEEIARGGMGVVYKARQISLNRVVAIKMILSGSLASPDQVNRFYSEAESAANLLHPAIVPIYEIGEACGQHFFSMAFIEGQNLNQACHHGPIATTTAANYLRQLAEAMHYAHSRGVIHRDLKPANILLDRAGQPLITDFGLARRTDRKNDMTCDGEIMGTPAYMAPEQAMGNASQVGPLADIYALGAILYFLITAEPPFDGESSMEILLQVLEKEPTPPSEINANVNLDLQTITLKCLEKDPSNRYASAHELVTELERFLKGLPISARPISSAERCWRWSKRNPWLATLATATSLAIALAVTTSILWAIDTSQALVIAEAKNQSASDSLFASEANSYALELTKTAALFQSAQFEQAQQVLDNSAWNQRGWEHGFWTSELLKNYQSIDQLSHPVLDVAWDPTGKWLAAVGGPCQPCYQPPHSIASNFPLSESPFAAIFDASTGNLCHTLRGHTSTVASVAFHPHGDSLVTASWDGTARVWNTRNGDAQQVLAGHHNRVVDAQFSPQGDQLATASWDNSVGLWHAHDGSNIAFLYGHRSPVHRIAFHPSGLLLASADWMGNVILWDMTTLQPLLSRQLHNHPITGLAFNSTGTQLASVEEHKFISLWNWETNTAFQHELPLLFATAIQHAREDQWIIAGQGTIRWSSTNQQSQWITPVNDVATEAIACEPTAHLPHKQTNARLLVGDQAGRLLRLASNSSEVGLQSILHSTGTSPLMFHSDQESHRTVLGHLEGIVTQHDSRSGDTLWQYACPSSPLAVRYDHSLQKTIVVLPNLQVASLDSASGIEVDRVSLTPLPQLDASLLSLRSFELAPDNTRRAAAVFDQHFGIWNLQDGSLVAQFDLGQRTSRSSTPLHSIAFHPSGKAIGAILDDQIAIWDTQSGHKTHTLSPTKHLIARWTFSPCGNWLAMAVSSHAERANNDRLLLYPLDSADFQLATTPFEVFGDHGKIDAIAFHPDGSRVAVASSLGNVRVWNTFSQQLLVDLPTAKSGIQRLHWSTDGLQLQCAHFAERNLDRETSRIQIVKAQNGEHVATIPVSFSAITAFATSADGKWLATVDTAGLVCVVDLVNTQRSQLIHSNIQNPKLAFDSTSHFFAVQSSPLDDTRLQFDVFDMRSSDIYRSRLLDGQSHLELDGKTLAFPTLLTDSPPLDLLFIAELHPIEKNRVDSASAQSAKLSRDENLLTDTVTLFTWNAAPPDSLLRLSSPLSSGSCQLLFSSFDDRIIIAGDNGRLITFDALSGKVRGYDEQSLPILAATISNDGHLFAYENKQSIVVSDLSNRMRVREFSLPTVPMDHLSFDVDNESLFAYTLASRQLYRGDIATGEWQLIHSPLSSNPNDPSSLQTAAVVSPVDHSLYAATFNASTWTSEIIKLDIETSVIADRFSLPGKIHAMAISADATSLACAGEILRHSQSFGSIAIVDAASGELRQSGELRHSRIENLPPFISVSFHPIDQRIGLATQSAEFFVWDYSQKKIPSGNIQRGFISEW
jgi:serine/threonine protein kinase